MKRDAAYFDQWYADMESSPTRDALIARILSLPSGLESTGLLSPHAIDEVTTALHLRDDALVLDVACGRGGYGIEIARRTGSRLIGIDFSAVAVEQARRRTARLELPTGRAQFHVGALDATGLPAGIGDGLMCIDSVQFAEPPLSAMVEFRRLLRPGGRLVMTCWEASDRSDNRVPPRIKAVHLDRDLSAAGFVDVQVRDKADWRAVERTVWQAAVAAPADSDPAMQSLQAEGRRSLDTFDALRRVFATATAP
ncbi:MAG TPA: class I SAM-dependent methyltransferase [Acidothermaceae bacterium]